MMDHHDVCVHHEHEHEHEMKGQVISSASPHPFCEAECAFSRQEHSIQESKERSKSTYRLIGLIMFYIVAMVVEIVGGIKANSLAVIADAAHLLTDITGLAISLFAVWVSGWAATPHHSYGYNRLEVLGALASVQLIWFISGVLIYESVERLKKKETVDGKIMFGIASFGFIVNLIMLLWLGHDHHHGSCDHSDHHHHHHHHHHHNEESELHLIIQNDEITPSADSPAKNKLLNINLQGAYIHIIADLIQTAGVMVGGAVIWFKPAWLLIDLLCTFLFCVLALLATVPMLKNIFGILMERAPNDINLLRLESDINSVKGVRSVHDLHVWNITVGKPVLACHVLVENGGSSSEVVSSIRDVCVTSYGIVHVTIQTEHD